MKICVELVPDSFAGWPECPISGKIWWKLNSKSFPEEGWFDFPVVVLKWWLDAAIDLARGKTRIADFRFMDGPFRIRVDSQTNRLILLRGDDIQSEAPFMLDHKPLLEALASAAGTVVEICEGHGWSTGDVDLLREALLATRPLIDTR